MKSFVKGLDSDTQLLVAIGAAVSAGCIPCLENIVEMAKTAKIEAKKLKAAALIGQFIKEQPENQMKAVADKLLGTHIQKQNVGVSCPADSSLLGTDSENFEFENEPSCSCVA